MTKTKQKVVIIGGGVAGLSAAHELIKRDFDVEVYELKEIPGGKARSVSVPNTGTDGRRDLPGEHGFRFFPRFYKHVTKTMSEIPFGNGTVIDNLVETTKIRLARFGQESVILPARFPRSLEEFVQDLEGALGADLGLTSEDKRFFAEKVWQLITSCKERRQNEYESIGWWEYLEADDHSKAYQTLFVEGLTRTLVAAKAKSASTKTGGDIFIQLIFDVAMPGMSSDRILNGPTNDVWMNPWLDFLKASGVKYHTNAPLVKINALNHNINNVVVKLHGQDTVINADYFICAVPIEVMAKYITPEMITLDPSMKNIITLSDSVAWMNGAQFYLNTDVTLVHGHAIYIDTPWALTSISQKQFWKVDLAEFGNGNVKGILSIDISDWDSLGLLEWEEKDANGNPIFVRKAAKNCTREQVLQEIWHQLKLSLNVDGEEVLKDEYLITNFLDPDIKFIDGKSFNEEPLLVNTVNSWMLRPFAYTGIPNLFLASDYVKTNTDLATMEGANEAARRAVNCILAKSNSPAPACEIYEMHEPVVFSLFKWIDKQRFKKGLPWSPHLPWWLSPLQIVRSLFFKLTGK